MSFVRPMLLIGDLQDLSARISRTEEWLAVQTMLDNGCTMRHQTEVQDVYEDIPVKWHRRQARQLVRRCVRHD